ncbi:hypothetical protein AAVH_11062 [Aphelenchoides avenae]|nr:hypothetical protein AAVH_11062 [Aphelenchus avenae]
MAKHVKRVHSDFHQMKKQTTATKTCKRHVSPDVAKQTTRGSAKVNLVKNVMTQSRHAVNAHQRAHLHARSREKCTAVVSTRNRNRNEGFNKSVGEKLVEPESDVANDEHFKAVEATDEPSMISTPDPPNGGWPNVVAGTDPEEDVDVQFLDAADEKSRPSARVSNTEIDGAISGVEKKASLATGGPNPKSPLPTTTLTAAATKQMVRALAELSDEEILQLDLAGVLELSQRQPAKHEGVLRTHRKQTTPIVGPLPPSSSARKFGKANFSPDGMLAFFT